MSIPNTEERFRVLENSGYNKEYSILQGTRNEQRAFENKILLRKHEEHRYLEQCDTEKNFEMTLKVQEVDFMKE